jgi:cytochrome P450
MATHGQHQSGLHDHFARLRRQHRVMVGDVLGELGGRSPLSARPDHPVFSLLHYDDVIEVLRDPATFSSGELNDTLGRAYGRTLLTMDEPDHRAARSVLSKVFSRRALEASREELFRPVIQEYVAALGPRGGGDLYRELFLQFPVTILHRLYGLSTEPAEIDRFHELALKLLLIRSDTPEVAMAAAADLHYTLQGAMADRRAEGGGGAGGASGGSGRSGWSGGSGGSGDDWISAIVALNDEAQAMSDDEVAWFLRLLLPAGAETTSKATGNLLLALLRDRTQWETLVADRSLVPAAVDEGLRWDGATVAVYRIAMKDTVIGGTAIPAGAGVTAAIGSANHDEAYFPDPDAFNVHRHASVPQLGFGHGIHLCLGHQMARMEAEVALDVLLEAMPNLRLDPDAPTPEVVGLTFRAPSHLRVRWD